MGRPERPLLEVAGLEAGYGPVQVLRGLSFHVDPGEVVVILGANGAGKTTTLRAVSGMIAPRGQVAVDADGKVIAPGDMKAQAEAVFYNLRLILREAGGSFEDVVKLTHYVVDLKPEHRPVITEIRNRYVNQENPPASTMIGVPALVMDGLVIEVEVVAVIDESRAKYLS